MPEDTEYLEIVRRGVEELNRRHGAGRFFLFHRGRKWSESERPWIGWESKRGKLEDLNRFLFGESTPELEGFLAAGERAQLEDIRFVITLDADTQLLRGHRSTVDRNAGPSTQSAAALARWPARGPGLYDHSTERERFAPERNRDLVLAHLCRLARDRSLHSRCLRCLPGPGRRRQLSRQRNLRVAAFHRILSGAISRGASAQSRSARGQPCARRAGERYRAARCFSRAVTSHGGTGSTGGFAATGRLSIG